MEALNESLGLLFLLSHLARVVLVIHYIADMTCIAYNYSTKLLPLVAKHSSKLGVSLAYPQHCGRVGHRHFYRKRALVNAKARFFAYIGVDNLLSWWCRLSATRTGMNSGSTQNSEGFTNQAYNFVNLKRKKSLSFTPLNCALKALIFALNDSDAAFVERLSKKFNIFS